MAQAKKIFEVFEDRGSKTLERMQQRAFTPDLEKTLRTWGIKDTSKFVGRSRTTITDLEKENKLPITSLTSDSGRKAYTLEHINKLREHFSTRPRKGEHCEPAILAVANFKGGVSKTTTAINFSQYLALLGYRVLFIDTDSQGSATQCFGHVPDTDIQMDETLLPFLRGQIDSLESVIRKTYWDGLDLIPANLSLYNAEFELPVRHMQSKQNGTSFEFYSLVKRGLQSVQDNYDVIIMDCPPSMGMISINAIYAANSLLIPIPPSMLDFSSTVQFFGMLRDTLSFFPEKSYDLIRLLITKYEPSDNSKIFTAAIRQIYGDYVLMPVMPTSEAIKKAGTQMRSIYEVDQYLGSKKTLDRVVDAANEVNAELLDLLKKRWLTQEIQTEEQVELGDLAKND